MDALRRDVPGPADGDAAGQWHRRIQSRPGLLVSRAVLLVPAVSALLVPAYPIEVFVRALAVGIAVAFVGALYPTLRAVRLPPMEALRHE